MQVRVRDRSSHQDRRAKRDCAEVPRRGVPEEQASDALPHAGRPPDALFELPSAAAYQVVADVALARIWRLFCRLPGTLDALQRDAYLRFAGRLRLFLHRVAVPISAREVHAAVNASRISLQHLLDEADALEELTPIEGRDEPKAANQVRHEGLLCSLMPAFRTDRILDRLANGSKCVVELVPQLACGGAALPRPLQDADYERRVQLRRP